MLLAALVPDLDEHEVRVLAGGRVPLEEGLRELVVGQLLVDHAAAALVDEQHRVAGDAEHAAQRRVALDRLLQRHRAHPGVVHVAQLGAERRADADEVALVGQRRAAAEDRRAEVVAAQLDVVREAAGGEDDGLAGTHPQLPARPGGVDAGHRAVADQQPLDAMLGADVHAVAAGRGAHRPDAVQAAVGHRGAGVAGDEDTAGRRLVLGQLGPVVRDRLAVAVGERVLLGQQLRRGRGRGVDGLDAVVLPGVEAERRAVGVVALGCAQPRAVAQEAVLGVRVHVDVVGDPVPEGRLVGRAAEDLGLLEQEHVVAQPAAEQRGGEAGCAAADDDHVGLGVGTLARPVDGEREGGFAWRGHASTGARSSMVCSTSVSAASGSSTRALERQATCASGRTSTHPSSPTSRTRAQSS